MSNPVVFSIIVGIAVFLSGLFLQGSDLVGATVGAIVTAVVAWLLLLLWRRFRG